MILYHASPTQGMKVIDPKKTQSGITKDRPKDVYASNDKAYAAGFCFNWNSSEGFNYGKDRDRDPWELKVPPKYSQRLNSKCSIYTVEVDTFRDLNISTPEYASKYKVKVLSEEKYPTALMCLRKNGVKVSILKRSPFMDNSLILKYKNIIERKKKMDDILIKNFKVDDSDIHGKGIIASKMLQPGEFINVALFKGQDGDTFHTTKFGAYVNHSSSPNAITQRDGDKYLTYAGKKINNGDEVTVDYTRNLELEQPDPSWV